MPRHSPALEWRFNKLTGPLRASRMPLVRYASVRSLGRDAEGSGQQGRLPGQEPVNPALQFPLAPRLAAKVPQRDRSHPRPATVGW
jgi:hypothetical protein